MGTKFPDSLLALLPVTDFKDLPFQSSRGLILKYGLARPPKSERWINACVRFAPKLVMTHAIASWECRLQIVSVAISLIKGSACGYVEESHSLPESPGSAALPAATGAPSSCGTPAGDGVSPKEVAHEESRYHCRGRRLLLVCNARVAADPDPALAQFRAAIRVERLYLCRDPRREGLCESLSRSLMALPRCFCYGPSEVNRCCHRLSRLSVVQRTTTC